MKTNNCWVVLIVAMGLGHPIFGQGTDREESSPDESVVRVIRLQSASAGDVMKVMKGLGMGADIVADDASNSIVVHGSEIVANQVAELVRSLDQSRETLSMRFFFVRGKTNQHDGDPGKLPSGMQKVMATLNERGVSELEMLASLSVQAREGARFAIDGSTTGDDDTTISLDVSGTVLQASKGESVRVTVNAEVREFRDKKRHGRFCVTTAVAWPVDEYVLLAVSPVGSRVDEVIALVVYVHPE